MRSQGSIYNPSSFIYLKPTSSHLLLIFTQHRYKKRSIRAIRVTISSSSVPITLKLSSLLTMLEGSDFYSCRVKAIVAHCRHFGAVSDNTYLDEITGDPARALYISFLFRKADASYSNHFTQDDPETKLKYTVEILHKSLFTGRAMPATLNFPLPSNSLAHPWTPVRCLEVDCPVPEYHYQGLYMHRGKPCTEMSRFGLSDPPPEVWHALKRVQDRMPERDDQNMVDRFVDYHAWLCTRVGETDVKQEEGENVEDLEKETT